MNFLNYTLPSISRLLTFMLVGCLSLNNVHAQISADPDIGGFLDTLILCTTSRTTVGVNGDIASWTSSSGDDLYHFKLEDHSNHTVIDEHNVVGTTTLMVGLVLGHSYRVMIAPACNGGAIDIDNQAFVDFVKGTDGVIHGDVQILLAPPPTHVLPTGVSFCTFGAVRTALRSGASFPSGSVCESFNSTLQTANGYTTPYEQLILAPNSSSIKTHVLGNSWSMITTALGSRYDSYVVSSVMSGTGSTVASLPVKLTTFSAVSKQERVQLAWSTATEKNSKLTEIQRSKDGIDYETIGRVNAAGESNTLIDYQFFDEKPMKTTNFYRLNMIDIDNTQEYSDIRAVQITADAADAANWCKIYPTEIAEKVIISITDETELDNTVVRLTNALGVLIKQETIPAKTQHTELMLQNLPAGLYYLYVEKGQKEYIQKLVKK